MIYAPHMLMIGAAGRDAGKTAFACAIIRRFQETGVNAAKVTAVQERDGTCPRGGEGCGVCSTLEEEFCITEELSPDGLKDTQRLLAAGARRVVWLRVMKEHLDRGAAALLDSLDTTTPVICESNSLRHAVVPGLFLMVRNRNSGFIKASAREVEQFADAVVYSDGRTFDFDFNGIRLKNRKWTMTAMFSQGHGDNDHDFV